MIINPKIFRAYDVRGIYPDELDEPAAARIGAALVQFLSEELKKQNSDLQIVVGQDARISSPQIFQAFTKGVLGQGANIIDIGLVSTDTLYFALNHLKLNGGVMITASHNPAEYNGIKMMAQGPRFISADWGMPQIKKMVLEEKFKPNASLGTITQRKIIDEYVEYIISLIDLKVLKKMKVVVDAGNGMGSLVIKELAKKLSLNLICLYCDPDGTFPNHPPDPLIKENNKALQQQVLKSKADFGLALDGDGDRTIFVDEKGEVISGDMTIALLAQYFLQKNPGSTIVYNLTCSKSVPEIIKENNGRPIKTRTGHAFMKGAARKNKAIFGGEISGHLYFQDVYYAESGGLTLLLMIKILSASNQSLSELIKGFQRYARIGEVNFKIKDRQGSIKKLAEFYADGKQDHLDGLTVEYNDWWFNARPSNTEPLLRIVVEADNEELVQEKFKQIKSIFLK